MVGVTLPDVVSSRRHRPPHFLSDVSLLAADPHNVFSCASMGDIPHSVTEIVARVVPTVYPSYQCPNNQLSNVAKSLFDNTIML